MNNFLSFVREKKLDVIYTSDKDYENFLNDIQYLPESVKARLIKEYLDKKKNGYSPQIDIMIEK